MYRDPLRIPQISGVFTFPVSQLKALPERNNSGNVKVQLEDFTIVEHLSKITQIATNRCLEPTDLYVGPIRSSTSIRNCEAILLMRVNCNRLKEILGYVRSRAPDSDTIKACLASFTSDHINGIREIESLRSQLSGIPFSFHYMAKERSQIIEAHLKQKAKKRTYLQYKF